MTAPCSFHRGRQAAARGPRRQSGFGLVELMIAVVVLSVGLLGIVLSQVSLLRTQRQAQHRLTAIQVAGGMAERMRLNVAAFAASGAYTDGPAATTYLSLLQNAAGVPAMPASFDPLAQAAYDLAVWRNDIAQRLDHSTAAGVVRPQANNPYARSVVVMWLETQPTEALRTAGQASRGATCPGGSGPDALVCDPGCPTDGLVAGAPLRIRCFELEVFP